MSSKLKQRTDVPDDPRQAPDLLIEAALFSAGEPLSVDEIVSKTQVGEETVEECLEEIEARYAEMRTSFHVVRSGNKWGMVLREAFADESRDLVPPEIPFHVLRTLALIAYHQPLLQSDLQDMVGSKVYSHVGTLVDLGLVSKEREGITYELTTTTAFPEYFGIPSDENERIRNYLAEKVGLLSDGGAPQTQDGDARDAPPVPGTDPD